MASPRRWGGWFLGGALVTAAAWMGWPFLTASIRDGWDLLVSGDPTRIRERLLEFGVWAPVISALLQILSSLIPVLPGFVISIANAMVYGAVRGGILTFATSLLAAAICFGIARAAGRPAVERVVSPVKLAKVDAFVARSGFWAVFWGRLLPFINPDLVSYGAGLTRLGWWRFLVAMGAGALPATIFYSIVGATAAEVAPGVIVLVAGSALLPLLLLWILGRRAARREKEGGESREG